MLTALRQRPLQVMLVILGLSSGLLLNRSALCTPTQQDVFKSISDNVGKTTDGSHVLIWMCGGGGVLILLALLSQRQRQAAMPKPLIHQGKLLKEILRNLPLRRAEIKQLSVLAETTQLPNGMPVSSPLTLLLCPSVLARGINNKSSIADRRVLAGIYKKLMTPTRASSTVITQTAPPKVGPPQR